MADTANANENANEWGDLTADTLMTPVTKFGVAGGFALVALARFVMGIVTLTNLNGAPSELTTFLTFDLIQSIGVLVFSGAMVLPALFNAQMASWARVTMVSVGLFLLVLSAGAGVLGLLNLFAFS